MKKTLCFCFFLLLVFALCACGNDESDYSDNPVSSMLCQHDFREANCTEAMRCIKCGKTLGEPLGHVAGETSCTSFQYCTVCHEILADAVGHITTPATCTESEKCTVCGEVLGRPLGHNVTEATCTESRKCTVCGEVLSEPNGHDYDVSGKCEDCDEIHPEAHEYITFHDAFLEGYIKQVLGVEASQKVSTYAMSRLTSVSLNTGVEDAQDLRYAINLKEIEIQTHDVANLDILCEIPSITSVRLGFNMRIDISFMRNMHNVEEVFFHNAEIVGGNWADLVCSKKLKYLYLYATYSNGIEYLEGANALETLIMWHAYGEENDISVLTRLPNLKEVKVLTYKTLPEAQKAVFTQLIAKGVFVEFI